MDQLHSAGTLLYEKGWRQGAFIRCTELSQTLRDACRAATDALAVRLGEELQEPRNVLLVLAQACDIAASCSVEPTIEGVIAKRLKPQKPYAYNQDARSSRYLELQLADGWYKAEVSKILHIPKQILLDEGGNLNLGQLSDQNVEVLARWRANRYMRTALPDAFNAKLKPLVDDGLFNEGLEHAGGLYLHLEPFAEADSYRVHLFALERSGSPPECFADLQAKMEAVLEAIHEVPGLVCPYLEAEDNPVFEEVCPAMRRYEVSIALRDHFLRWNFDYLSLKANDSAGIDEN